MVAKKRLKDGITIISKKMTLLQCLSLLESLERDMLTLSAHDAVVQPYVLLPDLAFLIASVENLLSKEKENDFKSKENP